MKKLLVFVDTDVVIRHFIKSETFRDLESEYNLTFVFNQDSTTSKKGVRADVTQLGLERILHTQVPRRRAGHWYFLFAATVLRQQRGLRNFTARRRQLVDAMGSRNVMLLELLGLPVVYHLFRMLFKLIMGVDQSVKQLIDEEEPDAIIHPTVLNGYYINELLIYCERAGIPLVVLMNSWDNPSAKAVCTGLPTALVVWGDQSRQQAIDYMRIPEDRIKSFGAAQFQVYRKPPVESTDQLREMFRVPDNKKIILYAGSGAGDHETQYLRLLEAGIEKGLITNCHVIYRPHPWRGGLGDGEEDFYSIKWKHIAMDPFMEEYYQKEVKCDEGHVFMVDYAISNKLLTLVDAVISPLSTMLIESLIKGKPVLAFFPERHHGVHLGTDEVHFADFLKLPDVNVCLREEDFYPACQKLLAQTDDEALSLRLKHHASHFVDMELPCYGQRLELLIDRVTSSNPSD
jgi:hypothetical protein